jgi:hypothetical protein
MSNEPGVPGEDVRDGVADGTPPVPRESSDEEGATAAGPPGPGAGKEAPDKGNGEMPGGGDSTDNLSRGSGPAEDEDGESPDTRGLTTDTAPSD